MRHPDRIRRSRTGLAALLAGLAAACAAPADAPADGPGESASSAELEISAGSSRISAESSPAGSSSASSSAAPVARGARDLHADPHADEHAWRRGATAGGRWLVLWRPRPDPIPLNAPFEVDVRVLDPATERPVADLDVKVDAAMPAHHHGMNHAPLHEATGAGATTARGMLFHMPGDWELTVDVFAGTVSERARFPVELDG